MFLLAGRERRNLADGSGDWFGAHFLSQALKTHGTLLLFPVCLDGSVLGVAEIDENLFLFPPLILDVFTTPIN